MNRAIVNLGEPEPEMITICGVSLLVTIIHHYTRRDTESLW